VIRSGARAAALACAFAALLPWPASAKNEPDANANGSEGGYVGKGNVVIQTALAGAALTLGGDIALEERGSRLRLDVLSLGIPGTDPTVSALLSTQLFPAGGFTIVYDRRDASYTVWSAARHAFYVGGGRARAGATQTVPSYAAPAADAIAGGADLFSAFGAARSLADDRTFSASVTLTGHSTLFAHPVTAVRYQFSKASLNGGESIDAHGELELADDLDEVPVEVTASLTSKSIPQSSLRLDLTQLARQTPPNDDFEPPPAYTKANAIGEVIGGKVF
jgi:hypothetical protein